jgi:hypothetical protein
MLIAKIISGFQASIINVETAVLRGKLREKIYMNASNYHDNLDPC